MHAQIATRASIALIGSALVATPAMAALTNTTLKIRSTEFQGPFELRILVQKFNDRDGSLEISGTELSMRNSKGLVLHVPGETLRCEFKREKALKQLQLLQSLDSASYWSCYSGKFHVAVAEKIRIEPVAGFLKVGKQFLRQAIELIPRHEQLLVVNTLGMDAYLGGLVNKEIRSDWPEEAIKAQVIAARSYALSQAADRRKSGEIYDLLSTQADQVYDGAAPEDARSFRLVKATGDKVLMHRERVLKAYYHAANGGYMESPENVWGHDVNDYDRFAYKVGPSPTDEALTQARWRLDLLPEIGKTWSGVGELEDLRIHSLTDGRRVRALIVQGKDSLAQIWTAGQLRQKLGGDFLKSNYFKIVANKNGKGWSIEGSGWGHGVGLSQLGAQAMAKAGKKAEEILHFYYPFASIRDLPLNQRPHEAVGPRALGR